MPFLDKILRLSYITSMKNQLFLAGFSHPH